MRCIGFMEGLAAGVYAEIEFATEKSYAAPVR